MFIEDAFRPFWTLGLNNVSINKSASLTEWIRSGKDYQVDTQVSEKEFKLTVFDRNVFLCPISQDCNRFATSALESIIKPDDYAILPKNLSWILIKQYYSAFYSAHLILRILGKSLSQLEASTIAMVKKVSDAYGYLNGINIENGYYLIDYSNQNTSLLCKKIEIKQDGGSHVALWNIFGDEINKINLAMLTNSSDVNVQDICRKLDELVANLDYVGSNKHSWLSRIRNDLNYKHLYGVWHPYTMPKDQLDKIKRDSGKWKNEILNIELSNYTGKEILRFSNTCLFIVGLGNKLCADMSKRCSSGQSFLKSGYSQVINIA